MRVFWCARYRADEFKKLLQRKLTLGKLHDKLGYVGARGGSSGLEYAIERHGGKEQYYLQALSHVSHTTQAHSKVAILHKSNLAPYIAEADLPLARIIMKSTQHEWKAAVFGETFICVTCGETKPITDRFTNEVIFQRKAVARLVEQMLQAGERVNGVMAILACCSFTQLMPTTNKPNVGIACSTCKNTHRKATDAELQRFKPNLLVAGAASSSASSSTAPASVVAPSSAVRAIAVRMATDFPTKLARSDCRWDLGQRAASKTKLFVSGVRIGEGGRLVNAASGQEMTLVLVGAKAADRCMSFDVPEAAEYKELLGMERKKLHQKLGFVAKGTGRKENDCINHGNEAKYLQALSWHNHTANTHDPQAILHKTNLASYIHPDDLELVKLIMKSTQKEWKDAVDGDTFECVTCGKTKLLVDGYTNEVVFQREAVTRLVKQMLDAGECVNGVMAVLSCCSFAKKMTTTGKANVGLACTSAACKNTHSKVDAAGLEAFKGNLLVTPDAMQL